MAGAALPFTIRPVQPGDVPFLWDMLYEAAIVATEIRAMTKTAALSLPAVTKWLTGWGRDGDEGVVAIGDDGERLGAAWSRLYGAGDRGSGIVAWPGVPELSIGVRSDQRGRGVGSALLAALIERARSAGRQALVLSVDPLNPAVRLYQRCGFELIGKEDPADGTSLLMSRRIADASRAR